MDKLIDLITGREIVWSEEEPARQEVERLLLKLGYRPEQVKVGLEKELEVEGQRLVVCADLWVDPGMVIRCAPGSVTTRRNEVLAAARLLGAGLAMASNGSEHELIAAHSGKLIAAGPNALPDPQKLLELLRENPPARLSPSQALKAARIYLAMRSIRCELS